MLNYLWGSSKYNSDSNSTIFHFGSTALQNDGHVVRVRNVVILFRDVSNDEPKIRHDR